MAAGLASLGAQAIGDLYQGSSAHPASSSFPSPLVGEGGAYAPGEGISWLPHKILHSALGFALGAASDLRDPLRGGVGGAIGAVAGEMVAPMLPKDWDKDVRVGLAALTGAMVAFGVAGRI